MRSYGEKMNKNKTGKTIEQTIYEVLKGRPFCNCAIQEADLYDAWCLRIAETVDMYYDKEKR